jgi:hypothetical protein
MSWIDGFGNMPHDNRHTLVTGSPSLSPASAQLFRCHPPIYNEGKTIARVVASGVLLEVTCDEKTIP